MATHYLACDLGAESGRVMLATLDGGRISLEELHRFPNGPVKRDGALHWNIEALFAELKTGLKKAAERRLPIASRRQTDDGEKRSGAGWVMPGYRRTAALVEGRRYFFTALHPVRRGRRSSEQEQPDSPPPTTCWRCP